VVREVRPAVDRVDPHRHAGGDGRAYDLVRVVGDRVAGGRRDDEIVTRRIEGRGGPGEYLRRHVGVGEVDEDGVPGRLGLGDPRGAAKQLHDHAVLEAVLLDHRDHRLVRRVRLGFDAHHRAAVDEVQDVLEPGDRGQRRHQPAGPELRRLDPHRGERRVGVVGDQSLATGGAVQRQVVHADQDAVGGHVDRDLHARRTPVQRGLVGRQAVLGQDVTGAAVGDLVRLTPGCTPALDRERRGLVRGPAEPGDPSAAREQPGCRPRLCARRR